MFFFHVLEFSLFILVCANPAPEQSDDFSFNVDFAGDFYDPQDNYVADTVFDSQNVECASNALDSEEVFEEDIQKRAAMCRGSIAAPKKISQEELDKLERIFNLEAKSRKPFTGQIDDNCHDESRPKFLTCGGPMIYSSRPDSKLIFVLNCDRGRSIFEIFNF